MKLLTVENAKTILGQPLGFLTGILYLAPSTLSGVNLCPWATDGCKKACLNTAGRGRFDSIQEARIIKTVHFLKNRQGFIDQLEKDIEALERRAKREGLQPAVRLNGTSDVLWERIAPQLFERFSQIQFYDYTKSPIGLRRDRPENYHLTYSNSENTTDLERAMILGLKENLAVVFKDQIPNEYTSTKTIDGTEHDLRFLDPRGVVVGLVAKGQAKKDTSGFVVDGAK